MATTILVLDGFGIGAMPDAGQLRPEDAHADTLGSLARWARMERTQDLQVPNLAALGLGVLRPDLRLRTSDLAIPRTARRSALGYPGADTFAGHQTMMGADMSHVVLCRVSERISEVRAALEEAGHTTETLGNEPIVVVDGQMLVHDNLEADPGLNWNVSARLDKVDWKNLLHAAQAVRSVAPVARVIAVGGYSERPLSEAVRHGDYGTVGLDTPATGFYRNGGLQVQHLGMQIDHDRQLPEIAMRAGLPVALIGKAADILQTTSTVTRCPGVATEEILADTIDAARGAGLVVSNVQQTDLAGHQQDVARYVQVVETIDSALPELLTALRRNDLLVVVADHGNDPLIGHPYHTREYVPVLTTRAGEDAPISGGDFGQGARLVAELASLADVGASVAEMLGVGATAHGRSVDLMSA